jgi:predicted Zn-ribbon and HTH transcriptional regulator
MRYRVGMKVTVEGWKCQRCGHVWIPHEKDFKPRGCPKCKSPYWDRPRQNPKRGAKKPAPES